MSLKIIKRSVLIAAMVVFFTDHAYAYDWKTAKGIVGEMGIDFRGSDPESSECNYWQNYMRLKGSSTVYNLTILACNFPDKWPYVYGLLLTSYSNGKPVEIWYDPYNNNQVYQVIAY